jgi:hypothetical protein
MSREISEQEIEMQELLLTSLSNDNEKIPYRPKLNRILDSVTAAILLQQMIYWASVNEFKPFYKFLAPCSHEKYRDGDDWLSELAFGRAEFNAARAKIATRVRTGFKKNEWYSEELSQEVKLNNQGIMVNSDRLVLYWVDSSGVTWYKVNSTLTSALLKMITKKQSTIKTLGNAGNQKSLRTQETSISSYTENTTENTSLAASCMEETEILDASFKEKQILDILRKIPRYKFDYTTDLQHIRNLSLDYPKVDILEEVKKWRDQKMDKPLTKGSNPRLQLRNWMIIANNRIGNGNNKWHKPNTKDNKKSESIDLPPLSSIV